MWNNSFLKNSSLFFLSAIVATLVFCFCCSSLSDVNQNETTNDAESSKFIGATQYSLTIDRTNGQSPIIKYFEAGSSLADVEELNTDPEKEGYSFNGWNQRPSTMPDHNLVIKATWNPIEIHLTINPDNGESVQQIVQLTNSTLTPPDDPVKTGYLFIGWSPAIPEQVPTRDTTYTACWEILNYRVDFYEGESLIGTNSFPYNSVISFPEVTKEGYHPYWGTITTVPAEDIELHLEWVINQHTVTFAVAEGNTEVILDYGSEINIPDPGRRVGYYFDGWDPVLPDYMPDYDLTSEAIWRPTLKAGTGEDANRFIADDGYSVIVSKADLAGFDSVTIGIRDRWYLTFDPSALTGDENIIVSVAESPTDSFANAPKGTSSIHSVNIEDEVSGTVAPVPMTVSIPVDIPKGKIPFAYLLSDSDPIQLEDADYSGGMMTFTLSALSSFATGFSDPDDPVPVSLISAVAVAALAAGSLLSVAVYRGGRKV